MTDPAKAGAAVAGSGSQWTLLGGTQAEAANTMTLARQAAEKLSAWSAATMQRAHQGQVVACRRIEAEPKDRAAKAAAINGVRMAISAEYTTAFSALTADFISVEEGLLSMDEASEAARDV